MISSLNKLCGLFLVCGHVQVHVSLSSHYSVFRFKYASIGCKEKKVRKEMKDHENATKHHLTVALNKIAELYLVSHLSMCV